MLEDVVEPCDAYDLDVKSKLTFPAEDVLVVDLDDLVEGVQPPLLYLLDHVLLQNQPRYLKLFLFDVFVELVAKLFQLLGLVESIIFQLLL